jgi:quercetin dioxygenase-like cupin family protein
LERRAMKASEDRIVRIGALELRFLIDETNGSGQMVMFEFVVPPEARVPAAHYHRDVDEAVYVLSGVLSTIVDGERRDLKSGASLFIPRGAVHVHENHGDETARALIVMTPGSIGRSYFEEMAGALAGPGKPDPTLIADIMGRHGLVVA